jgi:hypothetical protein
MNDSRFASLAPPARSPTSAPSEVQHQPVAIDLHRHRIDQERHVVVDDLDDRVRRLPAVFLEGRIEHADPGVPRLPLAREVPVRQRSPVEVGGLSLDEILRLYIPVVTRGEIRDRLPLRRCHLRADELQNLVEPSGAPVVCVCAHRVLFAARTGRPRRLLA